MDLPYEALLALPYLATIPVLALTGRNVAYLKALLKPYYREGARKHSGRRHIPCSRTLGATSELSIAFW